MIFELEAMGGPWARRLAHRRKGFDVLPWHEVSTDGTEESRRDARVVWTQSAFSEYASAACFAEIASAFLAAGAPIDLIAAAGDFVVDEMLHAELSARIATALGGAVPLEVNLARLVRPPTGDGSLLRAAELVVRTSCVGEALTVPILKAARAATRSTVVGAVLKRIVSDESHHAQLGGWFLEWADDRLTEDDRARLGRVASEAVMAFAPLFTSKCITGGEALGVLDCAHFDPVLEDAIERRVKRPLAACGIQFPVYKPRRDFPSVRSYEATMNEGTFDIRSSHSVVETIDRLDGLVRSKGLLVFGRIDFAHDAGVAGLSMKPMQALLFGNPKAGTPLLVASPRSGLDLPLKALAWEDSSGVVWVSANTPEYVLERHALAKELASNLAAARALIEAAAG
jgi:uncharacterized protein (DUF302 family)